MPRRKKKATEQTTDEALKRLFRKPVLKKVKQLLVELDSDKHRGGGGRDRRKRNDD